MSQYIDGFVIPLKKKKVSAYKKLAKIACKVWMDYGALSYYECAGDEVDFKWGLSFKKLCKLKSDETVIFAFIVYKSKAQRNRVNKKVMSDPRLQMDGKNMPFDMKRFSMGGFKAIVKN